MVVSDQLNRFSMASEKEGNQKTSVKLIVVSVLCIYIYVHAELQCKASQFESTCL